MLRASEVVSTDHSARAAGRGLRGADIAGRALDGSKVLLFFLAVSIDLLIRGSKTDKFNQGISKTHFRVGAGPGEAAAASPGADGGVLCVVQALEWYQLHAPERFAGGRHENEPFLVWADGRPLTREDLQVVLGKAAVGCGEDPARFGSHSLRFGGASALWAAFQDSALVQRWGRWKGESFHGYLWEGRDTAKGVATKMVAAPVCVL